MFLKKAMAWILTAMLVFPLAACGSQPATLSGTEEESASSAGQESFQTVCFNGTDRLTR